MTLRLRLRLLWMKFFDRYAERQFLEYPSGICGCGEEIEGHPLWDNHSPTDIPYRREPAAAWLCWFMGMDWRKQ